jgi:Putative Ig domain
VLLQPSPNRSLWQTKFARALQRITILALTCEVLSITAGCAAGNSGQSASNSAPAAHIQVAISPDSVTLIPGSKKQFTATLKGTGNSAVIWSASAGSISSSGLFAAPTLSNGSKITIAATSVADSKQSASSSVTIQNQSLEIEGSSPSAALANTPYNTGLLAIGGTPPYTWAITAGSLPSGIVLGTNGTLAGTTTHLGNFAFTAKATDAASNSATNSFTLPVVADASGNFDGPAELPRVYLSTTLADTPAPGSTITVPAGGDLQATLNNANCGETVTIQAGATFLGQYTFPAKPCDDQHWIIVRTSAPDASLPAEGTRMTPCYAGVASLPGRPAFACPAPHKLLATIMYAGEGDGPIVFANGANHYRLLGLEITRGTNHKAVVALIAHASDGSASQIVLDRLYIHGTPKDETRRGIELSGTTSVAIQDSYISELHCKVDGDCVDSQAVGGGSGSLAMGPWKIDDNFLEAAGENILFGGSEATQTPADIEIRFNHLFKPMFWMRGQPGFTAPTFIVKNHLELKNAQRVLFDSNVLEGTWGGFTQAGFSVVLTPKNQDIGGLSSCPLCQVTDVTIRYTTISHVGGVFLIGNGRSDSGGVALAGERYSIHDVIADDIDRKLYAGFGMFLLIGTLPQPLLQDVEINHVTAFPNYALLSIGAPNTLQMPGFVFSNSIVTAGEEPVFSDGNFGLADCAHAYPALNIIKQCFSNYIFSPNAILASPYPSSSWPSGNFVYSTAAIGFVNYHNGGGGDYHLLPSSPAVGAASDGTDLGANVDAVLSAVSGAH